MNIILGTMTFSDQVDKAAATTMISTFRDTGFSELDTAFVYNKGKTEMLLGEINDAGGIGDLRIAGKANPGVEGGLSPQSVSHQLQTSLNRLNTDSLDLFYLHAPDLNTPIEVTLEAVFEHFEAGRFKRFGLSNYAAWQVAEIVGLCRARGWMLPEVYQGMYNALTRDVERELLPCLKHFGIAFNVYNPLAGGMLTGKYPSLSELPDSGRFATFDGYPERYWKAEYFDVISEIVEQCLQSDIARQQQHYVGLFIILPWLEVNNNMA